MPTRKIFQTAEDKVYFGSGDEEGCIVWEWKVRDSALPKARQVIPEAEAVSYFASVFRDDIAEAVRKAIEEKEREAPEESVAQSPEKSPTPAEPEDRHRRESLKLNEQEASTRSFVEQLPGALSYPFKGNGTALLVMGALFFRILFWLLRLAMSNLFVAIIYGLAISVFIGGYLSAYMMKLASSSAEGNEEPPDWPEYTGLSGMAGSLFSVIVTVGFYLLPALVSTLVWLDLNLQLLL